MKILVFIYGSLKEGFHNHEFLKGQLRDTTKVDCKTTQKYPLYNSENYSEFFPYLEDRQGVGEIVKGEMYEVKTLKHLENLDYFEGVPELYKRGKIEVTDADGNCHTAFTYFRAENLKDYREVEFVKEYTR